MFAHLAESQVSSAVAQVATRHQALEHRSLAAQRISLPVPSAQSLIKKWNVSSKSWKSSSSQCSEQAEMTEEPGLALAGRAVPVLQRARVQLSILHAITHGLFSLPKQKELRPNFISMYGSITWAFLKFSLVRIIIFLTLHSTCYSFLSGCALEEWEIPSSTLSCSHLLSNSNTP